MEISRLKQFTMADLRAARQSNVKVPILTCYDYTMARLMERAGIRALLVGDSAANVVLGHPTTLPAGLDFMIEITAAVRRGAPSALVCADMPFGSYHESAPQGIRNVVKMLQLSGCDCVKIEAGATHSRLVAKLADAGVAVVVHLGLKPQAVRLLGRYRAQGRTAREAAAIVQLAGALERAGAAAILLEAVAPEVSEAVVQATSVPVIGCGAGPACHAHVVVTPDLLGWTDSRAKFVPELGDAAAPISSILEQYAQAVTRGQYPAPEHCYEMPMAEKAQMKLQNNGSRPRVQRA